MLNKNNEEINIGLKQFGDYLKWVTIKHEVKAIDLAKNLNVSPPYLSKIFKGKAGLSAKQYDIVMRLLRHIIDDTERERLDELFISAKTGIESTSPVTIDTSDPLNAIIIKKIINLTRAQKIELNSWLERTMIDSLANKTEKT